MISATFLPYSVDPAALVFIPVLRIESCRWDLRPPEYWRLDLSRPIWEGIKVERSARYLDPKDIYSRVCSWDELPIHDRKGMERRNWTRKDWEYQQRHLAYERERQAQRDAWRDIYLPRFIKMERRRRPLHPDLQREFAAYGGRNRWIYFQTQLRPTEEVAAQIGLTAGYIRTLMGRVERQLIRRVGIKPFEWYCRQHRARPIDMGGPRDEWLEFTAPMALRTPDPRVEDMG